jgi:hypothetical protein
VSAAASADVRDCERGHVTAPWTDGVHVGRAILRRPSRFGCLPYVPIEFVGTAYGGTPPYQYGWSVMPMQDNEMTPNMPPIAIPLLSATATTATISTAQFPWNWASDLAPSVYGPGEIVRFIFSVTDAVGSVAVSSAPVRWTCGPG